MGRKAIDLTGRDFGLLHVVKRSKDASSSHAKWVCKCQCGNTHIAESRRLLSGEVRSCGCMKHGKKQGLMSDAEMSSTSDSLSRLSRTGADPWQNLANAIICVAADDYRGALKSNNIELLDDLTGFFRSDWYKALTQIKPDDMIRFLRRDSGDNLSAVYLT